MGLDMFLYKKYDIGAQYEHRKIDIKLEITENKVPINIDKSKVSSITTEFLYWRKFNALHAYIVDNYANGVDDCRPIYLSINDLEDICEILSTIINDRSRAEELLPTSTGFFFGSEEYDDYYYSQVEGTYNNLKKEITLKENNNASIDYVYEASW